MNSLALMVNQYSDISFSMFGTKINCQLIEIIRQKHVGIYCASVFLAALNRSNNTQVQEIWGRSMEKSISLKQRPLKMGEAQWFRR
jgi:hypothetical protein